MSNIVPCSYRDLWYLFCRLLFHLDSTLAYHSRPIGITCKTSYQKTNRIEQVKGYSFMYFFGGLDIHFKNNQTLNFSYIHARIKNGSINYWSTVGLLEILHAAVWGRQKIFLQVCKNLLLRRTYKFQLRDCRRFILCRCLRPGRECCQDLIFLQTFLWYYRSGTVNSNTVNSKFHLIRSFFEILATILSFHV